MGKIKSKQKIIINGQKRLSGQVRVAGAKNAALPELAAVLLSKGPFKFQDVPLVEDIKVMFHALENLGASGEFNGNKVHIETPRITSELVPREIVETSRASILILGPLVARNGYARVSKPGGCNIGDRNINYHLQGLRLMGAVIDEEHEHIVARAPRPLKAIEYEFPAQSVTGTENLLMAAALADGTTVLKNCALEPEVGDLIELLQAMGSEIDGKDTTTLTIKGKTSLKGTSHKMIPDRIAMGTYVIAGCLGENQITVENARPEYIRSLLDVLEQIGVNLVIGEDTITVAPNGLSRAVEVVTEPYPGYPTDLQAQLTMLLTQVDGVSRIKETIFNNRFQHAHQLNLMGADIDVDEVEHIATIKGITPLRGTRLMATDLRASAALVLGGLIASGRTVIENAYQLFRGYEDMPGKLKTLGADISVEY